MVCRSRSVIFMALLVFVCTFAISLAAGASSSTVYKNSDAWHAAWARSHTTSGIRGGSAASVCGWCAVEIRTTYSWSPYYPTHSARAQGNVNMVHGRVSESRRSACAHYLGSGSAKLTCSYSK